MTNNGKTDHLNRVTIAYLVLSFLYIFSVVQPFLYAHHVQAPFLFNSAFAKPFFHFPGKPAEYLADFIMQFFFHRFTGTFSFFLVTLAFYCILLSFLSLISKNPVNKIIALLTFTFLITMANNYNLPFSVIVSVFLVVIFLLVLRLAHGKLLISAVTYLISGILVYYLSGSGYFLLFSVSALWMANSFRKTNAALYILLILVFTALLPYVSSKYIFALPPKQVWLYLYPHPAYFMNYKPSFVFYAFLLSVPVSIGLALLSGHFLKNDLFSGDSKAGVISFSVVLVMLGVAGSSHYYSYNSDNKKVVAADYYCYINNPHKTAINAETVKNYSYPANVNYNLVMSKTGKLTEKVFDFLQITGSDALQPDIEFQAEMSFIAADFYYNLGFISEARHWAYETLVFFPNNRRSLQLLVKIHLITGEYKAADKCLEILKSGLGLKSFISEYEPLVNDTTLFDKYPELVEKRSFMPAEGELNPSVEVRLMQLLKANQKNKKAFEYLALYYLMESDAGKFIELAKNTELYFDKVPAIYEEALLIFSKSNELPAEIRDKISAETKTRFDSFNKNLEQYKNSTRKARNMMYRDFGNTYFYFHEFVYPHIIKPEIIEDDSDYPSI